MAPESSAQENPFRLLPSVEAALSEPAIAAHEATVGREVLTAFVQEVLDDWRAEVQRKQLDAAALRARLSDGGLNQAVEAKVGIERRRGVVPAINVSGVVLNTGLGRAPMHREVAARMAAAAGGYCVLEVDRMSGKRNERDERLSVLLGRLLGCEAGIAVNNNAAAAMLTMHTFAFGKEAIVSRGELVEIGGSFRVPDVMSSANARLVEVGATNRTRIADYERAIGPETGLLMKVHPSNFRVIGFTEEVPPEELAVLGRERGVTSAWDLGSGRVEHAGAAPLTGVGDETEVAVAVASGVDLVTFSGDKLLGGPQAGLIVGKREAVRAMRKNNLYRAMRLDKVSLAGLEATCELLLAGRGDELPTRAMLTASAESVRPLAEELATRLAALDGLSAVAEPSRSQPGSGSAPGTFLETFAVRVDPQGTSPDALARRLRHGEPPVFTRVQDGSLWVDPRTLLDGQLELLLAAFGAALR